MDNPVHVAVGVIINTNDEVLIALRHKNSHQGGLWEFPGGKIEPGEEVRQALARECKEELNLDIQSVHPLIKTTHHYPDRSVLLDVWLIDACQGEARGLEGQEIAWRAIDRLRPDDFPAANAPIIRALSLPREIAITPQANTLAEMLVSIQSFIGQQVRGIQVRQKQLESTQYRDWFNEALAISRADDVLIFANASLAITAELDAPAVHLTSRSLMQQQRRPVPEKTVLSAACHNLDQLRKAESIGVDLAFLSPIYRTASHAAQQSELGWERFSVLSDQVSLPVYALGGLNRADLQRARQYGAAGIAGIRMFQIDPPVTTI